MVPVHYLEGIFFLIFHMFLTNKKHGDLKISIKIYGQQKSRAYHVPSRRYTYFSTYRSVFGTIHSTRLVLRIPGAPDIEMRRLMARYDRNILKFIPIKFRPKIRSFDMVRTLVFETLKF